MNDFIYSYSAKQYFGKGFAKRLFSQNCIDTVKIYACPLGNIVIGSGIAVRKMRNVHTALLVHIIAEESNYYEARREKSDCRIRNENVSLLEIIKSNNQTN